MAFKHACFISYRNGKQFDGRPLDDLLNTFSTQVYDALESELQCYNLDHLTQRVFLDSKCLSPGQFLISVFSEALCKSVALIVIYTPNYLSKIKTFCASELKGMIDIESHRRELLNTHSTDGLIFTIVLRGPNNVPKYLKDRAYYDFSSYDLSCNDLKRHPSFSRTIKELAEKLANIYENTVSACRSQDIDLFASCNNFKIKDVAVQGERDEVIKFVEEILGREMPPTYPLM